MDTSAPSRNMDVRSQRLDFDDVSECEIPWEDLLIGERIGLGMFLLPSFDISSAAFELTTGLVLETNLKHVRLYFKL